MRFDAFEQVAALSTTAQQHILRNGDPRERVWAAWGLGLRLGPDFARQAVSAVDGDPDPGIRRHLIVVLAGLGETHILFALAEHDPDPRVRTTALVNLIRIDTDGTHTEFALARLSVETDDILRHALIRAVPKWPKTHWAQLDQLLADDEASIRAAALEAHVRARPVEFRGALGRRLLLEKQPRLQKRLRQLCEQHGHEVPVPLRAPVMAPRINRLLPMCIDP